jgi:hypothetical protein
VRRGFRCGLQPFAELVAMIGLFILAVPTTIAVVSVLQYFLSR